MPTRKATEQFIKEAKLIHGDKYNYEKVDYRTATQKVIITCKKHGPFEQLIYSHIQGCGCPSCSRKKKLTTNDFIERATTLHGQKYDYSLVGYKNNRQKVKIICPIHGEFEQVPYSHLQGYGCRACGYNSNPLR